MACGIDYAYSNMTPGLPATDVYQCMNMCSNYTELCYGIMFSYGSSECFLKNSSITDTWTPYGGCDSALVPRYLLQANESSEVCGFDNSSTVTLTSGANFSVYCDWDMVGSDFTPDDAGDYAIPYHADSLEDCMDLCAEAHPLCQAVSWNADMQDGYGNCYLKKDQDLDSFGPTSQIVTHSALLQPGTLVNGCNDSSTYSSQKWNVDFDQYCGQTMSGTDMLVVHENSFSDCMESCAQHNSCQAVAWDSTMDNGFLNCYLKKVTGAESTTGQFNVAIRVDAADPSVSAHHSTSLAWIAGPVIGGLVGISLVTVGLWWYRRRKQPVAAADAPPQAVEVAGSSPSDAVVYKLAMQPASELPLKVHHTELDAAEAPVELP